MSAGLILGLTTDDIYRGVLLAIATFAGAYARRNHNEVKDVRSYAQDIKVIVNGRTDRMQKRIEELTALLSKNGIDVPDLETSSSEPTEQQKAVIASGPDPIPAPPLEPADGPDANLTDHGSTETGT